MTDQPLTLFAVGARRRGRPRLTDAVATDQVRARVTPEQRRALERIAAIDQKNISEVIREAVDAYVSDFSEEIVFRSTKRD